MKKIFLALFLLSYLVAAPLAAQSTIQDTPPLPEELRQMLLDGNYSGALEIIQTFQKEGKDESGFWDYLEARTVQRSGRLDQAIELYENFAAANAESSWAAKARFYHAEVLAEQGGWEAAEQIWAKEVARLRGPERQRELAQIYLSLAAEKTAPLAGAAQRDLGDFAMARVLYGKALALDLPNDLRKFVLERAAWCSVQREEWGQAASAYALYLKEFEDVHASYAHADAARKAGALDSARRMYEDLAVALADDNHGLDATELNALRGLALYSLAFCEKGELKSIGAFRRFLDAYPRHEKSSRAAFGIAERRGSLRQYAESIQAYQAFLDREPPLTEVLSELEYDAALRRLALIRIGEAWTKLGNHLEARSFFGRYVARYSDGSDWSHAQRLMVDSEFQQCKKLAMDSQWEASREAYLNFLGAHPLDGRANQIMFTLGDLYRQEGLLLKEDNQKVAREVLLRKAIAEWEVTAQRLPGSQQASQALFQSGLLMELSLHELEQAVALYRACSFGDSQHQAQSRLKAMLEDSLTVRTERTWRSHQDASFTLEARNLESVKVEVYRLDLETYFRKHLTYLGVENLDLDLIAADLEFEYEISAFEKYMPMTQQVALPVEGVGVWAVAVSSATQRATTLVMRSDLDVIVRSSTEEALLFVQDMRLGKPASQVDLVLAMTSRNQGEPAHMVELTTGKDGVARYKFKEHRPTQDFRVFVKDRRGVAATWLPLAGTSNAKALRAASFAYTDRSAYLPGAKVSWRALVREVKDSSFSFKPKQSHLILISDPSGREIYHQRHRLSEFGTLTGDFRLSTGAPTGRYRLHSTSPAGTKIETYFEVQSFELQPLQITLEPNRTVYYRGEVVELAGHLAWNYGEPLAHAKLRLKTPDGRTHELLSDADGQFSWKFETQSLSPGKRLRFAVEAIEEGVFGDCSVLLAGTGFSMSASASHNIAAVGETISVDVKTLAPDGETVSRKVQAVLWKRTRDYHGAWQDMEVQRFEIVTSKKGEAQIVLDALAQGGDYALRLEGTDRFANPITAQASFFLSGEDDDLKLRMLVKSKAVNVGSMLPFELLNRAGKNLALLTFEGTGILEYRILSLEPGSTKFEESIPQSFFPEVTVSVGMMHGNEFFEASHRFRVARSLQVKVTPRKDVVRPGEEVVVDLEVVDQNGKPVVAEFSFAAVDQSLFEIFPDRTGTLSAVFEEGLSRRTRMTSSSSNEFAYQGVTTDIDSALLQEDERRLAEEGWERNRLRAQEELGRVGNYKGPGDTIPPAGAGGGGGFTAELGELGYAGDPDMNADAAFDSAEWNNDVGLGGGAGGKFGGRGGKGGSAKKRRGFAGGDDWAVGLSGQDEKASFDRATALWLANVVTDADGKATIRFTAPQQSTEWSLLCRGTDKGTTVGRGTASLTTRADFFIEARLPSRLQEGDHASVMVRLHNLTGYEGDAHISLQIAYPGGQQQVQIQTAFDGETLIEQLIALPNAVPAGIDGQVELRIVAEGEFFHPEFGGKPALVSSSLTRQVKVTPWGLPVYAASAGVLDDMQSLILSLPDQGSYSAVSWQLELGVGLDQLLIEEAVQGNRRPNGDVGIATELLGVLGVMQHLRETDQTDHAPYERMKGRAGSLLTQLLSSQQKDGSWTWAGARGPSDANTSAMAMMALFAASEGGLQVSNDQSGSGIHYLKQALSGGEKRQTERRARLLYALSLWNEAEFSYANSLHRERQQLSVVACAYTARALIQLESKSMAGEMVQAMLTKLNDIQPQGFGMQCMPMEQTALALSATLEAWPGSGAVESLEEKLMRGRPWYGQSAHGLALAALAQHRTVTGLQDQDAKVLVQVGNGKEQTIALNAENVRFVLGGILDSSMKQPEIHVRLRLQGKGTPHYRLTMKGFDTNPQATQGGDLNVTRAQFLAPRPVFDGREIEIGFNKLKNFPKPWANLLEHLEFADVAPATVDFYRTYNSEDYQDDLDFLTLDIQIPAGAQLLPNSVEGNVLAWRVEQGVLKVDVGQHRGSGRVHFQLRGLQPGNYRTLPTVLRSAYRPDRYAIGHAAAMQILKRGEASDDTYRSTPDELLGRGLAAFHAGEKDLAWEDLTALLDGFENWLRTPEQVKASRALLQLAVERHDANRIVHVFETLKEKDSGLSVPFARLTQIAEAYRQLGEWERAARIYRAVAKTTFSKDLQLVSVLEQQNDFHAATEAMYRFWLEYPDFPNVIETGVTLADRLLVAAPTAYKDQSLRDAGRNRAVLLFESVLYLQRFLALYPDEPVSGDAALNLVSAFLDLEDYANAARLADEFAGRYNDPRFADTFLYTQAVAEWYKGEDAKAVALLKRITMLRIPQKNGNTKYSKNRDLAIYILAQIHHARQDFADAAGYYQRVDHVFADAREVLANFRHKALAMDEITEIAPGETAKLELHYRNLQETEILVYPVDLMTLYLREKNLAGITQVNLAGIEPVIRRTVALPDDESMRQQDFELELELPSAGAYLIICRSEAIHASGMVLVSDFELVVETDPEAGGVRAQAVDRVDGHYLRDVDIRAIGAQDSAFHSGHTDPRGLFVTTGIRGAATVIARHDGRHYAFYRGAGAGMQPTQDAKMKIELGKRLNSQSYFDNVRSLNSIQQESRSNKLREQQQKVYLGLELNSLEGVD